MAKCCWVLVTVLWLISQPSVALGSPEFPEEIRQYFNYDCMPSCILCHRDLSGGSGTAGTPFASAMLKPEMGMKPRQPDTVQPALAKLEQSADTTAGVAHSAMSAALRAVPPQNPNGVDIDVCIDGPQYGCFASRVEPRGALDGWGATLAALVFGLIGLLRFRRRR